MLVEAIDTQTIVYEAVQKETCTRGKETTIKWCLKTCCGKRKATVDLLNTVSNKKAVVEEPKNKINMYDSEIHALHEKLRK